MRVAIFQGPHDSGAKPELLAAMDAAAAAAAAGGARLLVLPELFLTGYNIGAERLRREAEPADGPSAAAARAIAGRHGLALLYGYPERGADGRLHNAALLVDRDGRPSVNYRKTHLFGDAEKAVFAPGDEPCVLAEIDGVKVGVLVCYDIEFPETVRGLALRGADLVAAPTALMAPYAFVADVLVRARAYESQVFVMYANRCGAEGGLTYVGRSCIVGPDGEDLARAGKGAELLHATLDAALLARSRSVYTYLPDRRPAQYAEPSAAPGRAP